MIMTNRLQRKYDSAGDFEVELDELSNWRRLAFNKLIVSCQLLLFTSFRS